MAVSCDGSCMFIGWTYYIKKTWFFFPVEFDQYQNFQQASQVIVYILVHRGHIKAFGVCKAYDNWKMVTYRKVWEFDDFFLFWTNSELGCNIALAIL